MTVRRLWAAVLSTVLAVGTVVGSAAPATAAPDGDRVQHSLRTAESDENFYFVMADRFENGTTGNDTGGLTGDRTETGFDPTGRGWYNGGDLAGLRERIDYIQGLGTTAIWLTPSFKNKPVQGEGSNQSAGYHGYWVTDFTQIDPHLGTNAELAALIATAHARGMKVYFDIITNHTADVIQYQETGGAAPYISKDAEPYRTASGQPFDDRDYAGTATFPDLDAQTSFPYTPVVPGGEEKVPGWLNDVTLYHNRGDTTFAGENSQYGDFFGLDDLFTEHPAVVDGMIDIYQGWIRDFKIDGFRIDTMKHVNDEFWQKFAPQVLDYAHAQGIPEFFMFGEVFDTSRPITSHYTTADNVQAVLDFPFQDAARKFASQGGSAADLGGFFVDDDWYTDADSNVYQLPTFLGNHDMGRIGYFIQADNPGAGDAVWLSKDRLAHELMYFSRGNPVIYYGDEQGFTGSGGDQLARQSLFASRVPDYLDDDLIGTDGTHAQANFNPDHPLYAAISDLAALTQAHPALRDGAQQHRYASNGPGIYAFSRTDTTAQREYVVALNNSTAPATAAIPTYSTKARFTQLYPTSGAKTTTDQSGKLTVTVPPLTAVVYLADTAIAPSKKAPVLRLNSPQPVAGANGRMALTADVEGSSFYEVTFQARVDNGDWETIGTDDNAPYRVFHDISSLDPGTRVQYRAAVLDNAGHTKASAVRNTRVPAPVLTIQSPTDGGRVHADSSITVQAVADPERADHVVIFERRLGNGSWTTVGTDESSPVYSITDDLTTVTPAPPNGTVVTYRATLTTPNGTTAIDQVQLTVVDPITTATVHYYRPAGDYQNWGLHLWGDALPEAFRNSITWDDPFDPTSISGGWANFELPLMDDTQTVFFIVHTPGGGSVPTTQEPGGDRSFVPINVNDTGEIWLIQGDPTIYTQQPAVG